MTKSNSIHQLKCKPVRKFHDLCVILPLPPCNKKDIPPHLVGFRVEYCYIDPVFALRRGIAGFAQLIGAPPSVPTDGGAERA